MREFFCGWKRQFGVVTLVMGMLMMCGWVSSMFDDPVLPDFPVGNGMVISSRDHSLVLMRELASREGISPIIMDDGTEMTLEPAPPGTVDLTIAGSVPYWSVVVPLTVLSACLLIGKSSVATKRAPRPSPVAGVESCENSSTAGNTNLASSRWL